ncbi:MAG TPA: sigma 54-interacting transcriptional regulator, partial [Candidatus Glassbacteria bacterium]|nr:sigma 54-interacting transcriptional regulator [Candidatus Glassbacteria bacterium]
MNRILIIDDDRALCRSLEIQLTQEGHRVESAHSGGDGLRKIADFDPGLVLLDVHLPDMDGLDLLQKIQQARSQLPVVIITGRQEMKVAIEAMRRGAFDYLRKPFDLDEIFILLEKAARLEKTSRTVESASVTLSEEPAEIVGSSRPVIELMKQIGLLARSRVTVLIEGESGTGKELVARALHEASSAGKPFVAINCSAVVPTLLESELFGHEKGAFTGADNRKTGRLEHAGEGTVFLDEIG